MLYLFVFFLFGDMADDNESTASPRGFALGVRSCVALVRVDEPGRALRARFAMCAAAVVKSALFAHSRGHLVTPTPVIKSAVGGYFTSCIGTHQQYKTIESNRTGYTAIANHSPAAREHSLHVEVL